MVLQPRVLIFDSGLGGLSVARAVRAAMPQARLIYGADTAGFPYGSWEELALIARILTVMRHLVSAAQPDLVIVACNTASTLAITQLREMFPMPFVGTVPAIKPAAQLTRSNVIGVLATPGTARREYTQALIHTYAFHCKVFLHGAPRLAAMAEARLKGGALDMPALKAEIAPVFRTRSGLRTDVVVLGCTHYPLIMDQLEKAAPWPVTFIDPAPAIARRAGDVLAGLAGSVLPAEESVTPDTVLFTGLEGTAPESLAAFAREGFEAHGLVPVPV